jgi:hypothetical protein
LFQSIKNDAIVSFLSEKCSLTEAQIDTIMLYQSEGDLKTKASLRDKHKVSEGAFVRTLRQGQKNIEACMHTFFLLQYLGLAGEGDLERLSRLGALISQVKDSAPDSETIERLIVALEEFTQTFSHRQKLIV